MPLPISDVATAIVGVASRTMISPINSRASARPTFPPSSELDWFDDSHPAAQPVRQLFAQRRAAVDSTKVGCSRAAEATRS